LTNLKVGDGQEFSSAGKPPVFPEAPSIARWKTIAEAIAEVGEFQPNNAFTFQDLSGTETRYPFPRLEAETARRAASLQQMGLKQGDRLGLVVIEPEDFVLAFLAALRVGVVPVPMYPPHYLGGLENYCKQTAAVLSSSKAEVLVASNQVIDIVRTLPARVNTLKTIVPVRKLSEGYELPKYPDIAPDDLAFLQYTSGSTMEPRGVMVTHRALVNNIRAFMGAGLKMDPNRDSGVSWLPLYHDMGLIGFVLGPLFWGVSVVFIPTLRFVKNASAWLDAVDRHRATVTFAPNFAFALATRRARSAELKRWDLSCLKAVGCGAEPIHPPTVREFLRVFGESCRLSPDSVLPAYGLAECTLAITMKTLEEPIRARLVDRHAFQREGVARTVVDSQSAIEHVSCGRILPGSEVTIRDPHGKRVSDEVEGEIWVRGPSVAGGYFGDGDAWARVWHDGWLWTGDLGYLSNGELYVTGRSKDLVILNGRNHHPQTIEWSVAAVDGVREGNVAAFSLPGEGGEELIIVVEARAKDLSRLIGDIEDAVHSIVFARPAEVVCLRPGSLPKTSSGKLKRHEIRNRYLRTRLDEERLGSSDASPEPDRLGLSA
jgi:fatty-acyl-CoA synthase